MEHAVDYFDETNVTTGQRKRNWCSVKHIFRRIPNPQYITRFRKYVEAGVTKQQKKSMTLTAMSIINLKVHAISC